MYFITIIQRTSNFFKGHFNFISTHQSHFTCATHFMQLKLTQPAHYNISSHIDCIRPASNISLYNVRRSSVFDLHTCSHPHQLFFIIHPIQKTYSSRYQISLDFLINFVMPCPNFTHFKCINKYFINLYHSTCEPFFSFF